MASLRQRGLPSSSARNPAKFEDREDTRAGVSPVAICLLMTVVTAAVHLVSAMPQWLQQPPDPYHMDVLEGLGDSTEGPPRQLRAKDSQAANIHLNAQTFDRADLDNDGRPAWLLKEVASNYQRGLHKAAQAAAVENDGTRNVWDLFEGLWQCASHARIGKVGDGGKWVCDPHKLAQALVSTTTTPAQPTNRCIVYSFGSNGEVSFELEAHSDLGCEVHTFDPTLDEDTAQRLHRTPGIQFHAWGLAAGGPMHPDPGEEAAAQAEAGGALAAYDDKRPWASDAAAKYKTFSDIMAELGHTFVDVLKVDIEGGEWDVFNDDLLCAFGRSAADGLPFGQVLVELHWPGPDTGEGALFGLMRGFHAWGFRVFHREPNVANVQRCWEFAMAKVAAVNEAEVAAFQHDCYTASRKLARGVGGSLSSSSTWGADLETRDPRPHQAKQWLLAL